MAENPALSVHWGFRIRAVPPAPGPDEGQGRAAGQLCPQQLLFYARTFASDDDLNTRTLRWLDTVANVRTHGDPEGEAGRPVPGGAAASDPAGPLARWPYRPVVPRPAEGELGPPAGSAAMPHVEVERRPLSEYARIAGEAP